jgi:DNA polymerase-4
MSIIRKIIHIDMDAFFASVEQRDNPELQGKPVAVGGSRLRGVVAAASYEARKYGVRSAMPSVTALKKCPHLVFTNARFDVYKEVSLQIRSIFEEYTDLIEPLSLDEAYLDVTENKMNMEFAMDIADEIRQKIKERTQLTASAGISYNKFLAKIASDFNKPNGSYVVSPKMANKFIEKLPIEKFFGVGKVTAKKMHQKGIFTGLNLKQYSESSLIRWFGKAGKYYYHVARGVDNRAVNPNRIRKSLGAERTYEVDLTDKEDLLDKVSEVVQVLIRRIKKANSSGKTLTLKVKYADFQQITRSKTISEYYSDKQIYQVSEELVELIPTLEKGIRLVGLQISNFEEQNSEKDFLRQLEFDFLIKKQ